MNQLSTDFAHKIKTADELRRIIGPRPRKDKVIMCHGVFDVVHPGHLRHLLYAKTKASTLIASLTSDAHVEKGHHRPHVPQDLRALNLAAYEMVDYVIIDQNAEPIENIKRLEPDFFAKGYEYVENGLPPKTNEEYEVLRAYGGEMIFTPGDIVYSSSSLIDLAPPRIRVEKLLRLLEMEGLSFDRLREAVAELEGRRVHVVGDTIVDSHTQTTLIGGQIKTPTVSVLYDGRTDFAGAAAVVAKHLRAAGAEVVLSTVLGDDALKDFVLGDLREAGVDCRPVIDPTRPTTNKNAIITDGYRLLKIDTLDNRSISDGILHEISGTVRETECDAVVFSDFRHGIFNSRTVPELTAAIADGVYRVADSQMASRWGNITDFKDFDLITPNEREARFVLADQESGVRPLAAALYDTARCKTLILKLGDRGIYTCRSGDHEALESYFSVDSFVDQLVDPVGAGDALLAYATLAMLGTGSAVIASILGSMAAACACEVDGNLPVPPKEVMDKIDAAEKSANYL